MRLNVGAGDREFHAGHPWINIDARPEADPDLLGDVVEGLPFRDECADLMYAGHFFEHVPLDDIGFAAHELFRLLKPGGAIMVVGPDVGKPTDRLAELRRTDSPDADTNPALHSWDCTAAKVEQILTDAGFVAVHELPITDVGEIWPVFDRVTADQFAVAGVKPL
jgi:predicted SAM-dependent methyltransferase